MKSGEPLTLSHTGGALEAPSPLAEAIIVTCNILHRKHDYSFSDLKHMVIEQLLAEKI